MSRLLLFLMVSTIVVVVAIIVYRKQQKPRRIIREGKLLESRIVYLDGEKFYVEKVVFKDWHVSIHSFYLISDRIGEGHAIIDQRWSYEDFCDITVRLDDYTYALNRQVEAIALVRSFRSMPIDEFDRIAQPLILQSV